MSRMQRDKGKRGELQLCQFLTDHGHPAERSQQYCGNVDAADIFCKSLPFHIEVKRTECLSLYPAMQQAVNDAGEGSVPLVAHRRNRREWLAILRLDDLLELLK